MYNTNSDYVKRQSNQLSNDDNPYHYDSEESSNFSLLNNDLISLNSENDEREKLVSQICDHLYDLDINLSGEYGFKFNNFLSDINAIYAILEEEKDPTLLGEAFSEQSKLAVQGEDLVDRIEKLSQTSFLVAGYCELREEIENNDLERDANSNTIPDLLESFSFRDAYLLYSCICMQSLIDNEESKRWEEILLSKLAEAMLDNTTNIDDLNKLVVDLFAQYELPEDSLLKQFHELFIRVEDFTDFDFSGIFSQLPFKYQAALVDLFAMMDKNAGSSAKMNAFQVHVADPSTQARNMLLEEVNDLFDAKKYTEAYELATQGTQREIMQLCFNDEETATDSNAWDTANVSSDIDSQLFSENEANSLESLIQTAREQRVAQVVTYFKRKFEEIKNINTANGNPTAAEQATISQNIQSKLLKTFTGSGFDFDTLADLYDAVKQCVYGVYIKDTEGRRHTMTVMRQHAKQVLLKEVDDFLAKDNSLTAAEKQQKAAQKYRQAANKDLLAEHVNSFFFGGFGLTNSKREILECAYELDGTNEAFEAQRRVRMMI